MAAETERRGRRAERGHKAPRQPRLRALLLAAAIAPSARSQSAEDLQHILQNHPGCFHKGFQYDPAIRGANKKADNLAECQTQCTELPNCVVFAYFPFTRDCYFGDWKARMVESPYGAIAGYGVCPEPSQAPPDLCRTEAPNNGFPGISANLSNQAWPSGRQPWSLECWPKNWTGGYIPCQRVSVLQDMQQGWPGKCHGLTQQSELLSSTETDPDTKDLCQKNCWQNELCATWQTGAYGECWQGVGRECFVRQDFNPRGAQRLQHGEVRKLMDLSGWQIVGLFKSFDNSDNYFLNVQDAVTACKFVCYSDLRCQYWQYSPKYGCLVEDPSQGFSPAYPLTLDWAYRSTSFALDCVAGEYIQHYCPDHLTTAYPSEGPEEIASCMRRGLRYDPPDMVFQGRTVEVNAAACQARCSSTLNCKHFAFWPDGGCHLQDQYAKQTSAEDYRVVSGPPSCNEPLTPEAAAETSWLTEEGEKALNEVSGQTIPARLTAAPKTAFLDPQASERAQIKVSVSNLDVSSLSPTVRQQLQVRYADAFSRGLELPMNALEAEPHGPGGQVQLWPEPPASCGVVAYTPKSPGGSSDISQLQASLESDSFANLMKAATITVLGSSNSAIKGTLEVANPSVQLVSGVQATTAAPLQEHQTSCDFICMYWPIILGCVFLTCIGGLLVGFASFKNSGQKKASRKRAALLSDAEENSNYEPSEYELSRMSDGEDGDASIWNSEPSWDNSPIRGSPEPPRDLSVGDMSIGDSYSARKGATIFEA
mmetsp:Transcript_61371/g.179368  ORF Transcript_61371/g.179368 Transcript_61371/m.179368 type:complete len:765 (-) Transcript_61371:123-2417(-)